MEFKSSRNQFHSITDKKGSRKHTVSGKKTYIVKLSKRYTHTQLEQIGIQVTFMLVPAHQGTEGNEHADEATKQVTLALGQSRFGNTNKQNRNMKHFYMESNE